MARQGNQVGSKAEHYCKHNKLNYLSQSIHQSKNYGKSFLVSIKDDIAAIVLYG